MASISPPTSLKFTFPSTNLLSAKRTFHYPSKIPDSAFCRCAGSSENSFPIQWRWDSAIQDVLKAAVKRLDSYSRKDAGDRENENGGVFGDKRKEDEDEDWDWDRWKKHFDEVDEREGILSALKEQLSSAVNEEDFEDAARLKVAIAAAATNDTVGMVMSHLQRAVDEERFQEATVLRDTAGAGLIGWWAGVSEDVKNPFGLIIRITAEHGRYVARRYRLRKFTLTAAETRLFEIFVTANKKGEYTQQAVYLKRRSIMPNPSSDLSGGSGAPSLQTPPGSNDDKSGFSVVNTKDAEDGNMDDGSDMTEGLLGFPNLLRDMIPGVKPKVLRVRSPGKVDGDFISKVFEKMVEEDDEDNDDEDIMEEEDEEDKDFELDSLELESDLEESDEEVDEIIMDGETEISDGEIIDKDEKHGVSVRFVFDGPLQMRSGSMPATEWLREPAKLEKKGRFTFSFSVEKEIGQQNSNFNEKTSASKSLLSIKTMSELTKKVSAKKMPLKLLNTFSDLVSLALREAQSHESLSGSTTFHRIEIPRSPDHLNGLYVRANGSFSQDVIQLQHKYGQWQDDGPTKEHSDLQFYEYVEGVKLIGDLYVPAGQVAFRAKIGKRYQLPHGGILPKELGVVSHYKAQGRVADPGFQNPRWVDGELLIIQGKSIEGGPLVGFIRISSDPFVALFTRLKVQP